MAERSQRWHGPRARGDPAARRPRPRDGEGTGEPARDPARADRAEPAPAAPRRSTRTRSPSSPSRSRARGVLQPIVVRPAAPAGRYELIAGERRLRAAQIAELETIPALVRAHRRLGAARPRAGREHGARGPQPGRGGARLRDARRRPRAHEGGGRPPRRPQPRRDLEPDPPARPARRGARADRGRPPQRGPRPRDPALQGPRRRAAASPLDAARRRLVGARDRAPRPRGRRVSPQPSGALQPLVVHPDLAEALAAAEDTLARARSAATCKVRAARRAAAVVELDFDTPGEAVELAERILARAV